MPTVLRGGLYRFFFYSIDRGEPPQVHVERDENLAKCCSIPFASTRAAASQAPGAELNRVAAPVGDSIRFTSIGEPRAVFRTAAGKFSVGALRGTVQTLSFHRTTNALTAPVRQFDGRPAPPHYSGNLTRVGAGAAMSVSVSLTATNPDVIARSLVFGPSCAAFIWLNMHSTSLAGLV